MISRLSLRFGCAGLGAQSRRCLSYDKTALTNEALQTQLEAGLDNDQDGEKIRVDNESRTISTAAGDLPISPLFNIDWIKARRRERKDSPGRPTGRFRRKLANNPYAQALATPIRRCPVTTTSIPRYFLQDFEVVKHPSADTLWYAPGPLSFETLQPEGTWSTSSPKPSAESAPRKRGPITVYALSRKSLLDKFGGPNKKYVGALSAMRTGMAVSPMLRDVVWRQDMGHVVLKMMRRHATDALIRMATREKQVLQPCEWEEVGGVKLRGCVLWLPGKDEQPVPLGIMNVDGAKYGQTMAVHDLNWLLGESEVHRLKSESKLFQGHAILVLRQERNKFVMRLHLLLWRLQGYLAPQPLPGLQDQAQKSPRNSHTTP